MPRQRQTPTPAPTTTTFAEFAERADDSLLDGLRAVPQAPVNGRDHQPRQVCSGHDVPVTPTPTPTPLPAPEYLAHSSALFQELGLSEALARDEAFLRFFSGDISVAQGPMRPHGWATGYALSIYGTEYIQQCPFGTGNGYGDGRAISVLEGVFEGRWQAWLQRWRQQIGDPAETAAAMQRQNTAITWREWLIAPAYEQATQGDFSLIHELQTLFRDPYRTPTPELAARYDRLRPREFFNAGGVSHYSCSS